MQALHNQIEWVSNYHAWEQTPETGLNPLRTKVYFGHHNDENSRSLSKPLNIGTHCGALETNFKMVPLAF
jgi:hypothetical protein